jgi:hypothetical protein
MRRNGRGWSAQSFLPAVILCLLICSAAVSAQQTPPADNPAPPRPIFPWEAPSIINQPIFIPPPPAPSVPERVFLPSGTVLSVVLETPLSSRIAKKDQKVMFRTTAPAQLSEGMELPPDTAIEGTVLEAHKPGGFGRAGSVRVKIDHVEISQNLRVPMVARLQSAETDKQGSIRADNARGTDMIELAQYTLAGTLLGSRIGGGKGAGIGAGAGALAALIIMMSRRGPDVYLEPGMPFVVVVDAPVELPGKEVADAQASYAATRAASGADANGNEKIDPNMTIPPNERPVLKRRPKKP